jgi:hypothetical protein
VDNASNVDLTIGELCRSTTNMAEDIRKGWFSSQTAKLFTKESSETLAANALDISFYVQITIGSKDSKMANTGKPGGIE